MSRVTRSIVRSAIASLVVLAAIAPAAADWVASGTFLYQDREWDSNGFTGLVVSRPIRFADIEIIDPNRRGRKAILATGSTDASGAFSILVNDSSKRTIYVRALTTSTEISDLSVAVETHGGSPYALRSADVPNHNANTNVDFGMMVAAMGSGGEAFNMFDLLVYGADFIGYVEGSRPPKQKLVTVHWEIDGGVTGAAYTSGYDIVMRDYAAYDDTVVLHEWGHYAMNVYSSTSNPGGTHYLADCNENPRLAFDEGRATALGCGVRRYFGFPSSNVYLRTSGASGPGGVQNWFDLEDAVQYPCEGSTSEVAVSRALWDISDGPETNDNSPGIDDSHDLLALPDTETWEVLDGNLSWPVVLESFWNGWFGPPAFNDHLFAMQQIFDFVGTRYQEDSAEPNDGSTEAAPVTVNGSPMTLTFFSDPDGDGVGQADDDWFRFDAGSGSSYAIETLDLLSGADTVVSVVDTDGGTVLDSNDDRSSGDPSSRVVWTAPRSDTFYIRVTNDNPDGTYGSYSLSVTSP